MIKKIKIDYLIILTGTLIVAWGALFKCQNFIGLDFDSQSFLYWDYLRSINLIPFKDFFYPYGLLFLYKTESVVINLIVLAILFIIFYSVFKIILSFTKQKYLSLLIFFSYSIFIKIFVDFSAFIRYGIIFPFVYFLSVISYRKNLFNSKNALIIGLFLGALFSFINDLFFYALIIYFIFAIYYLIFKIKKHRLKYTKYFIYNFIGFVVGASFLILYLFINDAFISFLDNYKLLLEVSNFAKVPFPPTLKYFENLFNLGLIVFSIIYLLNYKNKDIKFYIILALFIMILLLEQKNIIRSIYNQISIFGILLFYIYIIEIYYMLLKKKFTSLTSLFYVFSLVTIISVIIYLERPPLLNKVQANDKITNFCYEEKFNKLPKSSLESYLAVKEELGNVFVFSFPGDPVFYIIFKQNPPPFPSVYESTPEFAQDKQIKYIKENNIDFIIINTTSEAIQDGVPDRLRNKKLYDYIEDHFIFYKQIHEFSLLRKK